MSVCSYTREKMRRRTLFVVIENREKNFLLLWFQVTHSILLNLCGRQTASDQIISYPNVWDRDRFVFFLFSSSFSRWSATKSQASSQQLGDFWELKQFVCIGRDKASFFTSSKEIKRLRLSAEQLWHKQWLFCRCYSYYLFHGIWARAHDCLY